MFIYVKRKIRVMCELVLDVLFPLKERASRVRAYTLDMIEASPKVHTALDIPITTLTRYRESAIEDTIRALKYEKSVHAAQLLSGLLADYLLDTLSELSLFSVRTIVLVPMPLFSTRERARGYNQITLVLDHLRSTDPTLVVRPELLKRIRDTPPQTRLSRSDRLKNVTHAFETLPNTSYKDLHIFLIDDVTTTGATLKEAARTLEKAGAKVTALAIARA